MRKAKDTLHLPKALSIGAIIALKKYMRNEDLVKPIVFYDREHDKMIVLKEMNVRETDILVKGNQALCRSTFEDTKTYYRVNVPNIGVYQIQQLSYGNARMGEWVVHLHTWDTLTCIGSFVGEQIGYMLR